jgi:tRNA (guanine37-N1)-methyltransferase
MRFDVVTIFPEAFDSPLRVSLLGKAIESGVLSVDVHDLRRWAEGPHRKVDDEPFGGGAGMVMTPGPLVAAVEELRSPNGEVVLMSAAGAPLNQQAVEAFSQSEQIVLLCGRYEGIDARVAEALHAREMSVGEFVLAGGELAALVVIEAVARLITGVMGNRDSLSEESFTGGLLEYPQYTRPAEFRGLAVPEVLLSGDHARIAAWRREQAIRQTAKTRPELLDQVDLTEKERMLADKVLGENRRS